MEMRQNQISLASVCFFFIFSIFFSSYMRNPFFLLFNLLAGLIERIFFFMGLAVVNDIGTNESFTRETDSLLNKSHYTVICKICEIREIIYIYILSLSLSLSLPPLSLSLSLSNSTLYFFSLPL